MTLFISIFQQTVIRVHYILKFTNQNLFSPQSHLIFYIPRVSCLWTGCLLKKWNEMLPNEMLPSWNSSKDLTFSVLTFNVFCTFLKLGRTRVRGSVILVWIFPYLLFEIKIFFFLSWLLLEILFFHGKKKRL